MVTSMSALLLKRRINKCLRDQGYCVDDGTILLKAHNKNNKQVYRDIQQHARLTEVQQQIGFLKKHTPLALSYAIDGKKINAEKIQPQLIEVKSDTDWETLFRWWCFVWWSIPYQRPIGRQMRFIVWDEYHRAIIGLIGLQSPILAWAPRDTYLAIEKEERELWINQSLSAQRVGALPPYNDILGGKLVAYMLASQKIRHAFQKKYCNKETRMKKRILPNRLLFITTTGAFGKSPIYERLTYRQHKLSFFLGYTQGFGSFHISEAVYQDMLEYLSSNSISTQRGYGTGPSRKLRLITKTMDELGFAQGANHKIKRGIYLFTPTKNLHKVIRANQRPRYVNLSIKELSDFWKERWILPRIKNRLQYKRFVAHKYIEEELQKIEHYGE